MGAFKVLIVPSARTLGRGVLSEVWEGRRVILVSEDVPEEARALVAAKAADWLRRRGSEDDDAPPQSQFRLTAG